MPLAIVKYIGNVPVLIPIKCDWKWMFYPNTYTFCNKLLIDLKSQIVIAINTSQIVTKFVFNNTILWHGLVKIEQIIYWAKLSQLSKLTGWAKKSKVMITLNVDN